MQKLSALSTCVTTPVWVRHAENDLLLDRSSRFGLALGGDLVDGRFDFLVGGGVIVLDRLHRRVELIHERNSCEARERSIPDVSTLQGFLVRVRLLKCKID